VVRRRAIAREDPTSGLDWSRFFERYRPVAVRFARGLMGGDEALAEDLFQEAARSVFQRATAGKTFESSAHARNYLFRSLRNLAVDARSRQRRSGTGLDSAAGVAAPDPIPADVASRRSDPSRAEVVARAMDELPAGDRELLRLRFGRGSTFREISESLGTPISTLHSRVEAALRKVRKKIGNRLDSR